MLLKEPLLVSLMERTYAPVPFPLSHAEITEAVGKFFDYLTLPQDYKDAMLAKRPTDLVSDMGYVRTKGEKDVVGRKDFKEYFHYHPEAEEKWAKEASEEPKVRALFDAAASIYAEADRAGRDVLRALDAEFPGLYDAFYPSDKPMERILRFLKYDNDREGDFLARGHYDRGGCTLAIAESAPGLRIGRDDATLAPVVHQDKTALFFPALHFPTLTNGAVGAAWHDVVQSSEDVLSPDAARWAVVYFMNAPALPFHSSAETHTVVR